ncbi:MAG: hypothetical protein P8079_10425 [Gammaproteobacteria bacterium]
MQKITVTLHDPVSFKGLAKEPDSRLVDTKLLGKLSRRRRRCQQR